MKIWRPALLLWLLLGGCSQKHVFSTQDIDSRHILPPLQFTLTDAANGKTLTGVDFRGKSVLLYFGYTNCPDVCPTTLYDLERMRPASPGHPYSVTHTAAVYAFGPRGKSQFIVAGLSSTTPDYAGIDADLRWLAKIS